jgi:bifunctional oligoribonuclease and PAP phosphatase NrnA
MMKQILHQIENSENLLLASHISPDGDAVGSLTALGLSLEILGKKVTFYSESAIPAVYRFLPATGRITRSINSRNEFDVAVILDCSTLDRVGNSVHLIEKIPMIINIDHHVTNSFFGHLQLVDTWACATAEIVYWLIRKMDIRINKAIATSIYTGILTDTGSFRFSNTNENAFSICREMMEYGVDPSYVAQHVYGFYSLGRLKLLNRALNSIEISENGKVSIMTLTQEMFRKTHSQAEDTEGFLNYARNIKDIKVAALIQEQPASGNNGAGKCGYHISLRSDGAVDVSAIAAGFGGGGHRTAAGFCIASSSEEIKSQLFELAEKI